MTSSWNSGEPCISMEGSNFEDDVLSEAPWNLQHHLYEALHRPLLPMASSRGETILISSAGDMLTSRCRNSPYPTEHVAAVPYTWTEDVAILCCDASGDDLNTNICSPWGSNQPRRFRGGGLLGGAPAQVAPPLHHHDHHHYGLRGGGSPLMYAAADAATTPSPTHQQQHNIVVPSSPSMSNSKTSSPQPQPPLNRAQKAFRSPPLVAAGFDEDSIVPIQSFDYSQMYEGGGMAPQLSASGEEPESEKENAPQFLHGIPTFCSYFSNVKIRNVSAHPLGAHVLLISQAGLLYSYGLNNHGQLGIGFISNVRGVHKGYVMKPTIVTPLVENGGKAVQCAAGVNHSLVVVETEQRRLVKSLSFDYARQRQLSQRSRSQQQQFLLDTTETIVHHQMYGFGRNDFTKIGLVSPKLANRGSGGDGGKLSSPYDEMESVVLPHRVALRCSVQRNFNESSLQGIFAIAASAEHSAALVRRPSGDVELYTWGNAMHGALGLPEPAAQPGLDGLSVTEKAHLSPAVRVVPVPSFVACLSKTSNVDARSSSLLLSDVGEYPVNISLSRCCSFVVTSIGRCFSFGTSEDAMLGLGRGVTEAHSPTEILMPEDARDEKIVTVSAGASHVVICTKNGKAYAWGARCHAGLELQQTAKPQQQQRPSPRNAHVPKENPVQLEWSPKRVQIPIDPSNSFHGNTQSSPILQACAGYDCSFFVAESGKVFSTGKNSGRLGLGELETDAASPKSLFGGLHLFKQPGKDNARLPGSATVSPSGKRLFRRGFTIS